MLHKENKRLDIQKEGEAGNEHFAAGTSGRGVGAAQKPCQGGLPFHTGVYRVLSMTEKQQHE